MQPSAADISDDLNNLNLTSSATSTDLKLSTSSESESASILQPSSSTKHHHGQPCDPCWNVIHRIKADNKAVGIEDIRFICRLGSGDIGSVYLVELRGGDGCLFAAKVMDKKELMSREKEGRARIEMEILEKLDHPFLPTLYATLDSGKWSCLLTEFCPGGDLHLLRQRQPERKFNEATVRFYASEVVVALEYLHMLGIIYRDLKPENVLVRSDGHIMLTDFDLSLKNDNTSSTAHIVLDQNAPLKTIYPNCMVPSVSCFIPKRKRKKKWSHPGSLKIIAEPISVRSMSFVGTHEYLSPEIVSGEGHGNAVDWWTLGIFLFELFYGATPFKGIDNELTLANIVARGLEFPKEPFLPGPAKDLIAQLLVKDPAKRMGSTMGATAIKQHPFFNQVNWALLRCTTPPHIPQPLIYHDLMIDSKISDNTIDYY